MTDTKPPSAEAMMRAALDLALSHPSCFRTHYQLFGLDDLRIIEILSEAAATFAEQRAAALDNPKWDATDAAHPAWWRGVDAGVDVTVQVLADILDGKDNGAEVVEYEPLETLRRRLLSIAGARGATVVRVSDNPTHRATELLCKANGLWELPGDTIQERERQLISLRSLIANALATQAVEARRAAIEECVRIAEAVQGCVAENAQALMMKPRNLTLDKMREIDNRLAGQRHAATVIAQAIRALADQVKK